jgi:hypothetical protein
MTDIMNKRSTRDENRIGGSLTLPGPSMTEHRPGYQPGLISDIDRASYLQNQKT